MTGFKRLQTGETLRLHPAGEGQCRIIADRPLTESGFLDRIVFSDLFGFFYMRHPLCSFVLLLILCRTSCSQEIPDQIVIGSWNLEWFYDHQPGDNLSDLSKEKSAPNGRDWEWKLNSVAEVIGKTKPYIMAFQEVENKKVMNDLRAVLKSKYGLSYRVAYVEGADSFTEQDVALIFRDGLVEMARREQSPEQWKSRQYKNLSKHLVTRFEWGSGTRKEKLTIFNIHLRAMASREELRIQQAKLLREWVNEELQRHANVVILGDCNTEHLFGSTKPNSDLGILLGLNDSDRSNDLVDTHGAVPAKYRPTHASGRQYDRILYSAAMKADSANRKDLVFASAFVAKNLVVKGSVDDGDQRWKNQYSIPLKDRDISDHYPIFAKFEFK